MRSSFRLLVLLTLSAVPARLSAQAPGSAEVARAEQRAPGLNWVRLEGASECPSAAQLAERVEARVGRVLFTSVSEAGLFVDGTVRRAGDGWDVVLEVSQRDGTVLGRRAMHFAGEACAVIDDAVVLVIAVTLYPNSGLVDAGIPLDPGTAASLETLFGAEPTDPDPATLPAAQHAPAAASASTHAPVARGTGARVVRSEPWKIGLDGALIAGLGQLPALAMGGGGYLLIAPPGAWPIQAGAFLLPAQTTRAQGASGEARFDLVQGSIALCPWQPAWLRSLALCGGAEVGRLRARPSGFASKNHATSDAIASLSALALLRPQLLSGLHARIALIASLPLIQRSYVFETLERTSAQLFRMPQVAARVELGLSWEF